jgi:hypothetical protein
MIDVVHAEIGTALYQVAIREGVVEMRVVRNNNVVAEAMQLSRTKEYPNSISLRRAYRD